jgi:DNA-binding response OmpR family regulator
MESNYKILIADDEPDILTLLEKALIQEGFKNTIKAKDGNEAAALCRQENPDAVILDIMMPGMDGYEVCKKIREFSLAPILFLSSKNDEIDKILGLAVGGDDYVTKPFSPKEVVYRIKAQLRRASYGSVSSSDPIRVGKLVIDPDRCEVRVDGRTAELTAREYELLKTLAENKGRVLSRERLYESVWGETAFGFDNTVMVHIRHLREKIEEDPNDPKYIITLKGLGYKVVDPDER